MKVAVIASAAVLAAGGGSLETLSGSARVVERDGQLVLRTGILARCNEGRCAWTATVVARGRGVGRAGGTVAAGAPRQLRVPLRRVRPGRVRVVIDARLTPPDGEAVRLTRSTYVRVPR